MPVDITIRDLSPKAIETFAARAARESKSLQEYLLEQLVRIANMPTHGETAPDGNR